MTGETVGLKGKHNRRGIEDQSLSDGRDGRHRGRANSRLQAAHMQMRDSIGRRHGGLSDRLNGSGTEVGRGEVAVVRHDSTSGVIDDK